MAILARESGEFAEGESKILTPALGVSYIAAEAIGAFKDKGDERIELKVTTKPNKGLIKKLASAPEFDRQNIL